MNRCWSVSLAALQRGQIEGDKLWDGSFCWRTLKQFKEPRCIIHTTMLPLRGLLDFRSAFSEFFSSEQGKVSNSWFYCVWSPTFQRPSLLYGLASTLLLDNKPGRAWNSVISSSFKSLLKKITHDEVENSQCSATVLWGLIVNCDLEEFGKHLFYRFLI